VTTLWAFRSRPKLVTCGDRYLSATYMIMAMSFRFLYLIFCRLLGWLMLLGRACCSKTSSCSYHAMSRYSVESIRGRGWDWADRPCSPR
jgi:hypothetical protein